MKIQNGAIAALVTPFDDQGSVARAQVRELVDFQIKSGIHGLYVSGSTGEAMVLPEETRMRMAELAVEEVNGRVPVIVHVGTPDTAAAVRLAKHAQSIGADAISAVPPYYYRMTLPLVEKHYAEIAKAADLPFLLYNIPNLTGISLGADFIIHMSDYANIIGSKFTDMNLEDLRRIKAVDDGRISVYMGVDAMLLSSLVLGSNGGIGTFYNVMPGAFARICESYWAGDIQTARELQWKVCSYIMLMKKHIGIGLQTGMKAILREIGIDCGKITPPLMSLDDDAARALIQDLRQAGFFEFIK